ncbi:uncharacterized protein LOC143450599 [Clavelina lepadiformis]|uniref:uncharacterized protein LOC143450599 n=1 Tax=Clavelina lepadiformis TaxID=159417 RepID=UPI0040417CF3
MSEPSRSNPIMSGVNTFVQFVTTSTESSGKAVQLLKPKAGGGYKMDRVAFQKLTEHPEVKNNEVGVISISGGMRDGKSFLLTLLTTYLESGEDLTCLKSKDSAIKRFFHWRSGVKSETRGVWIWNKPYMITKKDGQKLALILMDTQGSFDPNSSESDSAIFAFSTLLSSLQMYNLKERIKMNELESLAIFTRYAEMAGTKAAKGSCFQTLLLLVRDWQDDVAFKFGMDEEEGDKESYLQHVLRRYTGNDENLKAVRDGITRAFKNVKCALLPHPGMIISGHLKPDDGREDKGTLLMKDISENFKNYVVIVFKTILQKYVEAKMVGDQVMTGTGLYNFAINLFQLLEDGKIQNPQSAMKALDVVLAQTLLQKLEEKYDQEMEQISGSYCTEKELMERHEKKLAEVEKKYEDEFNTPYPEHKETYKTQLINAIGPLLKKHKQIRLTNEARLRVQYEELIEQIQVEYWKALNEDKCDGVIQAEEKFRHNNLNSDIYHKEYHDKLMECLVEANCRWERRKLLKELLSKLQFKSFRYYKKNMKKRIEDDLPQENELKALHTKCCEEAVAKLADETKVDGTSVDAVNQQREKLKEEIQKEYESISKKHKEHLNSCRVKFDTVMVVVKKEYLSFLDEMTRGVYLSLEVLHLCHTKFIEMMATEMVKLPSKKVAAQDKPDLVKYLKSCLNVEYKEYQDIMKGRKVSMRELSLEEAQEYLKRVIYRYEKGAWKQNWFMYWWRSVFNRKESATVKDALKLCSKQTK